MIDARRISRQRALVGAGAAVLLGVLLGAFSSLGDRIHVMVVNGLANAAAPWIVIAFVAGALQRSAMGGAIAGAAALVTGVVTYYGGFVAGGYAYLLPFLAAWSLVAAGSGALFGLAGGMRADDPGRWRVGAVVLVAGALLAEAAYRLILLEVWTGIEWDRTYMQVAVADTVAAVVLLLVLVERRRWLSAFAILLPVAAAGLIVFLAAEKMFRWVSGLAFT
ncbi:MAG: DUF6518 family protein [Chloroflexota bacterium]|nr:DUF6518 family protein [Chloroflexota bacterium]